MAVYNVIGTQKVIGNLADIASLIKRQGTGAVQNASRISGIIRSRAVSWTAAALRRFSQEPIKLCQCQPEPPYLKDLITRLPAAKITQIKDFTPAAWARAKA